MKLLGNEMMSFVRLRSSSSMATVLLCVSFAAIGCKKVDTYYIYKFDKNRENPTDYNQAKSYCDYKASDYIIKKSINAKHIPEDAEHELYVNCMKYKGWDMISYRKEERIKQ